MLSIGTGYHSILKPQESVSGLRIKNEKARLVHPYFMLLVEFSVFVAHNAETHLFLRALFCVYSQCVSKFS